MVFRTEYANSEVPAFDQGITMICEGLKKDHEADGDDSVSTNTFHSCTPLNSHS